MKSTTIILLLFTSFTTFSQKTIEGLHLTFLSVDVVSANSMYTSTKFSDDGLKKIRIQMKIKSQRDIDINSFSLVNETRKLRMRPSDIGRGGYPFYYQYIKLLKTPPQSTALKYKPKVRDTFPDYSILEFNDINTTLKLRSKINPVLVDIYFEPTNQKRIKANFFFILPTSFSKDEVYLYYRNKKVQTIKF